MNILDLQSLEPPEEIKKLVVYLGDEAFNKALLNKITELLLQVSVDTILITGKAGRHKEYRTFWESNGRCRLLGSVPYSKRLGKNEKGLHDTALFL